MPFERRPNVGPSIRLQQAEIFDGFRSKDDLKTHSGQIIARAEDRQTGSRCRGARVVVYDSAYQKSGAGWAAGAMASTRRLAAILAADAAGYSRLMGADEEDTLERLKAVRRQLID